MEYKDIKTYHELYDYMRENIKYGFVSRVDNKLYSRKEISNDALYDEKIFSEYFLQKPEELLKNRYGICYDQVELIRKWLNEHNYETYTFYSRYHNHVFIIFKDQNKYYWFERAFSGFNGIYEGNSIEECMNIYKNIQFENASDDLKEIEIYSYAKAPFHFGFYESIDEFSKDEASKIILTRNGLLR